MGAEMLRFAQHDNSLPILKMKVHHRAGVGRYPGEAVPHPSAINVAATPYFVRPRGDAGMSVNR